jgi:hypothetical protein
MLRRIDLDGNGDTLLQPPAVYALDAPRCFLK